MTKKILAAAAAIVMCFALASCGSSDSSSSSSDSAASSAAEQVSSTAESKAEESKAEESVAEESKAEESKAEESKAEESKAGAAEESKAEEPAESEAEITISEAEPAASEAETVPSEGGFTIKGTGYTVEFSSDWTDMAEYKDKISSKTAEAAKQEYGLDASSFTGMNSVCAYKPQGGSQAPVFSVVEPVVNSLFKSVKIADLESALTLAMQQQMAGQEGFKLESKGIVNYNGTDFLELYTEYSLDSQVAKARQFFALNGDKEYVISFSIPGDMYDDFLSETEKVMKTFKFTED